MWKTKNILKIICKLRKFNRDVPKLWPKPMPMFAEACIRRAIFGDIYTCRIDNEKWKFRYIQFFFTLHSVDHERVS